jgi:hypothetical protein
VHSQSNMKLYQALFVLYVAAVAVHIATAQNDNGNTNGNYNLGATGVCPLTWATSHRRLGRQ